MDIKNFVTQLIRNAGDDPQREGLRRTPERFQEMWHFLTRGYQQSLDDIVRDAIFEEAIDEMIMVKHIHFYSLCEHHLLPFFGTCSIGYIPKGKLVGLSKIARIVDMYARRLQQQERLTYQIAEALQNVLKPWGVGVVTEAYHLCMIMRGVEKQDSRAVASAMLGVFRDTPRTRAEFLSLIGVNSIEV